MKRIFTYSDVISIVMLMIKEDDFIDCLPYNILKKINQLNLDEYKEFMDEAGRVADSIKVFLTGELNELNICSEEIKYQFDKNWIK